MNSFRKIKNRKSARESRRKKKKESYAIKEELDEAIKTVRIYKRTVKQMQK